MKTSTTAQPCRHHLHHHHRTNVARLTLLYRPTKTSDFAA